MAQLYKTESGYLMIRISNGALVLELSQARWWFYDSAPADEYPTGQLVLPATIRGKLGRWHVSLNEEDLSIQVVDTEDSERTICVFADKLVRIQDMT